MCKSLVDAMFGSGNDIKGRRQGSASHECHRILKENNDVLDTVSDVRQS